MYLVELISISVAFVSPVLSGPVDLALVAGLVGQTVVLLPLPKLALEP